MSPADLKLLIETVATLRAESLTYWDIVKVVGIMMSAFTGVILTATFWWMRYLTNDSTNVVREAKTEIRRIVKESKDDIRTMLKDMLAVRLEGLERRIEEAVDSIDALRGRYNSHFDKYHTRDG